MLPGVSNSNFTIESDRLAWDGDCKVVPSLAAPGFCVVQTIGLHKIGDASAYTHLTFKVRATKPYAGFKVDFATVYHPDSQFTSFKADFPADFNTTSCNGEWVDVAIPFTSFTWDWSSYTGEPLHTCAEDPQYCPSEKDLAAITQLEFWAEGVEGTFHLDIQEVGASVPSVL